MSKRFGRNQKRAMREALKQRQEANAILSTELHATRRDLSSARDRATQLARMIELMKTQITAANEVLGPSIALPPVVEWVGPESLKQMMREGSIRMMDIEHAVSFLGGMPDMSEMTRTVRAKTHDIIECGIDSIREGHLGRSSHAYLQTVSGDLVYRVNIPDLAQINQQEVINRLTHMLAFTFTADIKKRYGLGNRR